MTGQIIRAILVKIKIEKTRIKSITKISNQLKPFLSPTP